NGFKINVAGHSFGYSGDTQYDPDLIKHLRDQGRLSAAQYDDLLDFFWTPDGHPKVDLVYHEAGIPPIHTDKEKLQALSEAVTARMQLVHIADKDVPAGFVPGKPSLFATHVLRPTTAQSRDEILMDTMRMVSYLYDIPSDTLENLLRGAEICRYPKNTLILRKGPVGKNEPLQFFIIADGEVLVRDDRRLVTKLRKADTFGEWGISHQRGFRVADVVTTRPCQCIQLTEEQYWWLVERHPVIQDRIGKIRSLLPRLELAQARQQLRTGANTSETLSVITHMTIGQLSGLAIFSHVRTYKKGQHIIVQGEQTDGFYILLSGHLIATVRSLTVGDLSEGDIFGEMGLLEGVTRRATITVASADAEVLFVSTQNFLALLERMPAFSWGVREIAARRRDPARAVSA
ncbi:MAG: cyclic nucleotide-binding domain-containing protein, partial [Nitrospiraceae bacterium]